MIAADRLVRTTRTPREARPTPIVPLSVATTAMGRVVHRPPMAFAGAGRTTNQHHPSPDRNSPRRAMIGWMIVTEVACIGRVTLALPWRPYAGCEHDDLTTVVASATTGRAVVR